MEKNNSLRYVSGACFALVAILGIPVLFNGDPDWIWNLLHEASYVLIAIAMFASVPMLIAIGGGISAIVSVRNLICQLVYGFPTSFIIAAILSLVAWVLIVVAALNMKNGRTLGIVSSVLIALRYLVTIFGNKIAVGIFGFHLSSFLINLGLILGVLMMGLAFGDNLFKHSETANSKANGNGNVTSGESQIERLIKLKELLDKGVISQEEFEAKKKQILGM